MKKGDIFKDYIYPVTVFSGGMIGVGFLSLPYIAMKAGFWVMLVYFVVLTALIILINSVFCQISLKTPDHKRFPGFVGYYLGKWAEFFVLISIIIGTFGVLLAYIIVGGEFLTTALQPIFSGSILVYTLIYFILAAVIVFLDIKVIARVEFYVLILLFLSLVFVFAENFSDIKLGNIFAQGTVDLGNLFLPYGPMLFALWGISLIPEIEEMLIGRKKLIKRTIPVSILIVAVFYFIFTFLILGITGNQTTETALTGLKNFLGNGFVTISLLVGAMATFTAFITQGIILKKTLMYDLGIKHHHAFVMTCFTPLILFLIGFRSFIPLLSLVGGVLLGINGIFILLMYKRIGGKNLIIYPLSLIFLIGVIYEIIYFLK